MQNDPINILKKRKKKTKKICKHTDMNKMKNTKNWWCLYFRRMKRFLLFSSCRIFFVKQKQWAHVNGKKKKKTKTQQETLILSNPLNFYLKNWKCLKKKKTQKHLSPEWLSVLLPISSWAETGVWESLSPAPGSSAALAESLWEELSSLLLLLSRLGWMEVVVALVLLLSHVLLESSRKIKYLIFTLKKITTKSKCQKST